jgi:hypothetical protein
MTSESSRSLNRSSAESRRFGRPTEGSRRLRELTLDTLRRADGPLPLATVACRVAAEMDDDDSPEAGREAIQRVYLTLVRYEVPHLERRGVVEYSETDGTLRLVGPGTP